jgi:hypothetical protein
MELAARWWDLRQQFAKWRARDDYLDAHPRDLDWDELAARTRKSADRWRALLDELLAGTGGGLGLAETLLRGLTGENDAR